MGQQQQQQQKEQQVEEDCTTPRTTATTTTATPTTTTTTASRRQKHMPSSPSMLSPVGAPVSVALDDDDDDDHDDNTNAVNALSFSKNRKRNDSLNFPNLSPVPHNASNQSHFATNGTNNSNTQNESTKGTNNNSSNNNSNDNINEDWPYWDLNDDNADADDNHNFDSDVDESFQTREEDRQGLFSYPSPRFRLDSDLRTPLVAHHRRGPANLNGLNILNVFSYFLNVFVSYGIGVWGLNGILPTRWEIMQEASSLVVPARWAYWIWAPILGFEAIFAIAQLFPHYRARPIIQQGTGYYFFYTCLIQTTWTLAFAFKAYVLSFVSVVLALLCMGSLLASQQYSHVPGRKSLVEYWLFQFPFYLHTGWLIISSVVQFSMIVRHYSSDSGAQLAADVVALGVMLPAATFFLTGLLHGPDFVVPIVITWAYLAVAQPLRYPSQDLVDHYDHTSIVAVRDSSCFFAIAVTLLLVPRVVIWIAHEFCTINVVNLHLLDDWSAEEGGGVHHRGVGIGGVGNGGGRTRSLDDVEDDVVFEDTL